LSTDDSIEATKEGLFQRGMSQKTVIIIVPAYNEGPRVAKVIKAIPKYIDVDKERFTTKVVVVEDGSSDDTAEQARRAGATVLTHVMNCGAGAATRTGLKYAMRHGKDVAFIATIDADGQHATEDIETMIHYAHKNNCDMVVGNRLHEGNKKDMPFHRVFGNKVLTFISRVLFGIKIQDTQSGLRLYHPRALRAVSDYTIDRYGFCTETLWLAGRAKLKIGEVHIAVKYFDETLAKGQNNWGAILLIKDLLWIRINN
jgi:glycosyltransferase involved in cell wall biosynthesis